MRTLMIVVAAAMSLSLIALDADAKRRENDNDDYGRHRYDDRWNGYRDDRGNDRWNGNDNGRHYGWRGRQYNYRPHTWQTVNVYSQPEYIRDDYREIRCTDRVNPLGFLLGAGAGGLAGSTIGKGDGRTAAIAGGALLGGLVGNNVTRQRCTTQVFYDAPLGRPISWQAGRKEAYAVVPVREYRDNDQYCREYQSYAMIGNRRHETYGTACMQPDGSWQVID